MEIPTLYLKAPFLKLIREHTSKYVIRLDPKVVQLKDQLIYLADGHRTVLVFVTHAYSVPIDKISWVILDSIGYHSRAALRNSLYLLYGKRNVETLYILEVVVQSKSVLKNIS